MRYTTTTSPVGEITISTNGATIIGLHIEGDRYFTTLPADWQKVSDDPLLTKATQELQEYFHGERKQFDIPVSVRGTTFQHKVWEFLETVPFGTIVSYKEIAEAIGHPLAVRAVGSAVGRNPICIFIPCHRVLPSGGGLGGYVAGVECKEFLLRHEKILS